MYQRTVIPNGTRVLTEYIPHVRSVTLGVWFETGSRDENQDQLGYAHLLEHMTFKGSERYGQRDIAEQMDACGGQLNAFTGKEYTCYYARVLDENLPLAVDILQEILMFPLLATDELDKERGVILEEIKMYEDTPDDQVHDYLCELLWPDHPLGRNILGTRESILKVKRSELVSFMQQYYTSDRMIIAAAGNVDHDQLVKLAEQFSGLVRPSVTNTTKRPITNVGQRFNKFKEIEQTHLCLGGPAICRVDARKYVLHLLDTITGGGMSSRLFQELRENRGLVYSTYSYHSSYRDTGNFGVYAGCSHEQVNQVIDVMQEQLTALGTQQIAQDELVRAKGQLKGSLVLSLESTTNLMTKLAKSEMNYGRIFPTDEILAAIDSVSILQIRDLAQELYNPAKWSIACVGQANEPFYQSSLSEGRLT